MESVGGRIDLGQPLALVRGRWHWLIPAGVLCALLAPLLSDRTFATDWGNHLWLIWIQGLNIRDLGEPSYYLQSSLGAFYPYFAFYGGTLYAVLGVVSLVLSPEAAVALAFAGSLTAAYLGWTWIAAQAGVRGWWIQLPGCIAVTAPYAVTNLYGRGDIPEMVATSIIPLVAASALSLVRAPSLRFWPAAAFVAGVTVLTGTHALSLVWGTTFLCLCAAVAIASNWGAVREHLRRGLRLVWLGLLGVGLNAWMLVPLVLYHTRLLEGEPDLLGLLDYTDRTQLFSLFREGGALHPELTADLDTQLPVLALLWTVGFGIVYWGLLRRPEKRLAIGMAAVFAAFLALVMAPSLIEALPTAWRFIQFPYRLLAFVDLALVGLLVLALVAVQRAGPPARNAVLLLAGIAAIAVVMSVKQDSEVRSWLPSRDAALTSSVQPPPSWYAPLQFADGSAPIVRPTLRGTLRIEPASGRHDAYTVTYPPGPAGTVRTNILAGTYLVDVEGARPVGRTAGGAMVVRVPASRERSRQMIVSAGWGPAVEVGRWVSVVALFACLGGCGYAFWRYRTAPPGRSDMEAAA